MEIKIRKPLCFSEIGRKENQEDAIYPIPKDLSVKNQFFILCDGMGGHDSGEVASQTVSQALGRFFEENQTDNLTKAYFEEALNYAYDELDKKDTGAAKKMGTTMTCLYLHNQGYLVAHIGDSRIYHVRPNDTDLQNNRLGIIYQTSDHSLVNDLIKIGELTEEEAKDFPNKNIITRAMQPNLGKRPKADVYNFSNIKKGDYFFLCCDGVLEQLTNKKLCEILSMQVSDEEKIEAIKAVCDNKTKDNYTCILVPINDVINDDIQNNTDDEMLQGVVADVEEDQEDNSKVENIESTKKNCQITCKSHRNPFIYVSLALLVSCLILLKFVFFGNSTKPEDVDPVSVEDSIQKKEPDTTKVKNNNVVDKQEQHRQKLGTNSIARDSSNNNKDTKQSKQVKK